MGLVLWSCENTRFWTPLLGNYEALLNFGASMDCRRRRHWGTCNLTLKTQGLFWWTSTSMAELSSGSRNLAVNKFVGPTRACAMRWRRVLSTAVCKHVVEVTQSVPTSSLCLHFHAAYTILVPWDYVARLGDSIFLDPKGQILRAKADEYPDA